MTKLEDAMKLDAQGKCIVCGKEEAVRRRGLCESDYQRFRRARAKLRGDQAVAFEERMVERGLLLPSRQGQRPTSDDVFADELADFLLDSTDPKDAEEALKRAQAAEKLTPQQLAEHALDVARQATKAKKATKKRETKT